MKLQKILVFGYFGFKNNQIDGQTIKTREVYKLVKDRTGDNNVFYFDTQSLKNNKILFFKLIYLLLRVDSIIYLPGKNNLKSFFPIVHLLCRLLGKNLIYIVVGGWLVEFLKENRQFTNKLKACKRILVETSYLKENLLKEFDISNVSLFPNFRQHHFSPIVKKCNENNFKIVFMARIMVEKGIDYIFNFAKYVEENGLRNRIVIDFYGQINPVNESYFFANVAKFSFVNYKGVVEPNDVFETLSHYDLLTLPTFYEGEGFPGTIIDSYIAGVPVLVSSWKQLPEFVEVEQTGFLFNLNNQNQYNELVMHAVNNCNLIDSMKVKSYEKSKTYSAENAWEILKQFIN